MRCVIGVSMRKIDNRLEYCLSMARQQPYIKSRMRHYAVITDRRGKIVSEGRNSYIKTNPKMAKAGKAVGLPDKTCIHAELAAILGDKHNRGYKITVVRVGAKGEPMYSEPCDACKWLIKNHSNIKEISYSTGN